ncbi:MAG TPA: hypothetical protein VHG28_04805 [Longimicrobiaceae bacterium]|nr:hypothetical protein [Longimicrobiaceae bacterium]
MRLRRVLASLLLLCVVAACPGPTGIRTQGRLEIRADGARLHLTNHAARPVYTFIVERATAALIDWAPCVDPAKCEGIAPGQERRVPYEQIGGYTRGAREGIVYWWHLEPGSEGRFQPDSIRAEVVPF